MGKKSRNSQNKDDHHDIGPDDRVSWLADHVLALVLSFLSLKDAAVTSQISRRWRYVWCQRYRLNFNDKERMMKIIKSSKLTLQERKKYIDWVDGVIQQHKGNTIEEFKIYFDLDMGSEASISNWIEFAISKKVHNLELDFMNRNGGIISNHLRNYVFPNQLFNSSNSKKIECLKTLLLRCVNVNDEGLNIILRNCPVLENLSIQGSSHMTNPKINGNKPPLKNIEMRFCFRVESVEIRDSTSILSFTFKGSSATLILNNLQNLEKIHIDDFYPEKIDNLLSPISFCSSYLSVLELNLSDTQPQVFPDLPKVKHLKLTACLHNKDVVLVLTSLVEVCPNLQRFTCQMFGKIKETEREVRQLAMHPHKYLEVVEITGFYERVYYLELVTYFLEISVALKKLVIDPTDHTVIAYRRRKKEVEMDEEENKISRQKAQLFLESIIPAGVQLEIL